MINSRLRGRAVSRLAGLPPRREPMFSQRTPTASFVAAKTVGSFVPGLTRKRLRKIWLLHAALITDWAQIGGAELRAGRRRNGSNGRGVPRAERSSRTEVRGARAPYSSSVWARPAPLRCRDTGARQIIERINAYFGYRAVGELRLIQARRLGFGMTKNLRSCRERQRQAQPPIMTIR